MKRNLKSLKEYFFQITCLANSYGNQLLEKTSVTFHLLSLAAMLQKNKKILQSLNNSSYISKLLDLYICLFFHLSFVDFIRQKTFKIKKTFIFIFYLKNIKTETFHIRYFFAFFPWLKNELSFHCELLHNPLANTINFILRFDRPRE